MADARRAVVTGGTAGIGAETAIGLAAAGFTVDVLGRDRDRGSSVVDRIVAGGGAARFLAVDLASLSSVAEVAASLHDGGDIGVLVANAGVAGVRGITPDGFELAFGVNHLAHHLLVTGLIDRVVDGGRVVVVSSNAHLDSAPIDWDRLRTRTSSLTGYPEYRVSKLCNVMFANGLARRFPRIDVFAAHPGMVSTDIWRRLPWPLRRWYTRRMLTPRQGAEMSLRCAADPALAGQGGYWAHGVRRDPAAAARDQALVDELWCRSEEWTSGFRGT